MKNKILLVDDEELILEMLKYLLEGAGYEVELARNGQEAIRIFFQSQPTIVITDILMPVMDGWQLLERIREVSDVPVIILSALGSENDAVRGLKRGADDFVIKPARLNELLSRVEALLKRQVRSSTGIQQEYADQVLHIDYARHLVFARGEKLDLTPLEFRVLAALVRDPGIVVSTDRLLEICWSEVGGPEHVRVYIGYLRKKLEEDPNSPKLIQTVREYGYRYCPPDNRENSRN